MFVLIVIVNWDGCVIKTRFITSDKYVIINEIEKLDIGSRNKGF